MHKNVGLKTFGKFIEPSALELLIVFLIFGVLFIVNQIHHLHPEDLTSLGVATFKGTPLSGLAHWIRGLYNSQQSSNVTVYIFWLLVALLVYVIAIRFTKNAEEIVDDIKIRHYLWPRGTNRNSPIKEYIEKFGLRFIVLIILCLYLLKLSPPLLNWWKDHYSAANVSLNGLTIYLILLVFVTLYVHGLVVLIRSLVLRLRIINVFRY